MDCGSKVTGSYTVCPVNRSERSKCVSNVRWSCCRVAGMNLLNFSVVNNVCVLRFKSFFFSLSVLLYDAILTFLQAAIPFPFVSVCVETVLQLFLCHKKFAFLSNIKICVGFDLIFDESDRLPVV